MKKFFFFVAFLGIFFSCKKENFLQLQTSQEILEFEPNFNNPRAYRDSTDTISIQKISENSVFEKVNAATSEIGTLGEFDYIEVEKRDFIVGTDTPFFRFRFATEVEYRPDLQRRSQDVMNIYMEEENAAENLLLTFEYAEDSLRCTTPNCVFRDSLLLDSTLFQDVYFIEDTFPIIFINRNNGIIGFKTSDNQLFIQN